MTTTEQELRSFHRFAEERLSDDTVSWSMEELFDMWRTANPNPALQADDLAAVRAAVNDMEQGDRGIPAEDHIRELREKYNLPASE